MDSVPLVAKKGEQQNRVEPDRSRPARHETSSDHRSKRHPARLVLTGTNINDSMPFEELLDSIPSIGGKAGQEQRWPNNLHTDKAYDHRRCRCLGIVPASPAGRQNQPEAGPPQVGYRTHLLPCSTASTDSLYAPSAEVTSITRSPRSPAYSSASTSCRIGFERRSRADAGGKHR